VRRAARHRGWLRTDELRTADRRVRVEQVTADLADMRFACIRIAGKLEDAAVRCEDGCLPSSADERAEPEQPLDHAAIERDELQLTILGQYFALDARSELEAGTGEAAGDLDGDAEGRRPAFRIAHAPAAIATIGVEPGEFAGHGGLESLDVGDACFDSVGEASNGCVRLGHRGASGVEVDGDDGGVAGEGEGVSAHAAAEVCDAWCALETLGAVCGDEFVRGLLGGGAVAEEERAVGELRSGGATSEGER